MVNLNKHTKRNLMNPTCRLNNYADADVCVSLCHTQHSTEQTIRPQAIITPQMLSVGGEGDQTPHISPHTLTAPTENPDYAAADIQDGKDRLPYTTDGPSGHQLIRA